MNGLALVGFGQGGWGLALILGALMTLLVSIAGLVIGAVFGGLVAWARLSGGRVAGAFGEGYAALFRGLPELLVIYFIYFGSSALLTNLAHSFGFEGFFGVPTFGAGALAIGVISGAYQAEVFRGAFLAISRGELEAARAIGMSRGLMFRRVVAPQVFRYAIPGLGNLWQVALKDSSLISVTGLVELMRISQVGAASTRQPFTFYVAGGALYLLLSSVSDRLFELAERHARRGMRRPESSSP